MGARFLYATDFHYTTTPPAGRVDDYGEAIRRKVEEVVALAVKTKATLLTGGDLWHRKPGGVSIGEVVDMIRMLKPVAPVYGIAGNHDQSGHQLKSTNSQGLGALVEAGILVLVDEPQEVNGVIIQGCSYHPDYEVPASYGAGKMFLQTKPVIWLSHGQLVCDSNAYPYQVTRCTDALNPGISLLLNGHLHTTWGQVYKGDSEIIVNPGSIGRVARNETHRPSVVGISVADDGTVRYKIVELESAADANGIFGEQDEATKMDDDGIEAFAQALKAESGDLGQGELLAAVERACCGDKELRLKVGARLGI